MTMDKARLIFIVLLTSVFYKVDANISVWNGHSYSFDWYWTGSEGVYHIKTAADLAGLSRCFSTGYYLHGNFAGQTIILDNDIDLAGHEWTPIGLVDTENKYYEFAGCFDGNNHTIKGMSITKHNNKNINIGLFGFNVTNTFSVKNLRVEGDIILSEITGIRDGESSIYIGGLVGYTEAGVIENCQTNVNISVTINVGKNSSFVCGGIVGYIGQSDAVDICKDCFSSGDISLYFSSGYHAKVGGIVGESYNPDAIISNCASHSNIRVVNAFDCEVGGIVGFANFYKMENTLFSGNIILEDCYYGTGGGLWGSDWSSQPFFNNCLVTGRIRITSEFAKYSPFIASASLGAKFYNCYYLEGIPNKRNYGIEMTETELKSGEPLNGFDKSIWCFEKGVFPTLQLFRDIYTDARGVRMDNNPSPQIKIIDGKVIEVYNISSKTRIKVFNMNGEMIMSNSICSPTTINLTSGLYIIKIGNQTFKVSL